LREPRDEIAAGVGESADGAVAASVMAAPPVNHETNMRMKKEKI
jgi:hypothetical protein